jgi:hypothetical protein
MLLGLRMSVVHVEDKETSEVFAENDGLCSKQGEFLSGEESFCQAKWAFQEFGQTWSVGRAFRGQESPAWFL